MNSISFFSHKYKVKIKYPNSHKIMQVYRYGVLVIITENKPGAPSSNLGQGYLYFT